jgi:dihydroorotase
LDACVPGSKSRNSPFAGLPLPGAVVATFLRGSATVVDGKVTR